MQRIAKTDAVATGQVVHAVKAALGDNPFEAIDVAILDDPAIASLHQQYMGDPSPTDVLTFDLRDNPEQGRIEGQIVVSADTASRQARRLRLDPTQELLRYVIHGVLHLVGYDDDTPAGRRRMRREEDRVLALLDAAAGSHEPAGRRGRTAASRSPGGKHTRRTNRNAAGAGMRAAKRRRSSGDA